MGSVQRPEVEAFLLVDAPSQRLSYWTKALAALDSPEAPPIAKVIALYDAHTDQAVLSLRYHAGPNDPLTYVGDVAMVAEVDLIQFGELSSRERQRFSTERLGRCSLTIDHKRQVVDALQELVRRLRYQRASSPREPNTKVDPLSLVRAKGTRDGLAASRLPRDHTTLVERPSPAIRRTVGAPVRGTTSPRADTDTTRGVTVVSDPAAPQGPQQFAESTRIIVDDEVRYCVPPPLPRAARHTANSPPATESDVQTTISAHCLRSGKWLPSRVASLSLKGASLMTSALPRRDDWVDVALSYAGHHAVVRGKVDNVASSQGAAATGSSTFGVHFDLDTSSRRQLTALLTAARAAHVTIKPTPPRTFRRFIVEWPMCVGTTRGIIKAEAFDVSLRGMFVRPIVALEVGTTCTFSMVLDDGGPVVTGRARVVRQLNEQSATACGVCPGFGLSITEMTDISRQRWDSFIGRIERRAGKRVLVGAPPTRLAKLQAILSAAGYAVIGSDDPGSLVQMANADSRPADAALLDSRWLVVGGLGSWVEHALSSRNVPCIRAQGDARGARTSVDELLRVLVESE